MNLLLSKLSAYDAPQRAKAAGVYPYFRVIESDQDTEVLIEGKKVLMFGSNSYLGLTNHPRIKAAACKAIEKYGSGCAGSRFLNGTLDIHLELEEKLARFVGKEAVIIYSTGFQVNLGVVSCLTGREDYILWDELDHASIIEGHRLSFSKKLKFRHNDMQHLETLLKRCRRSKVKLIVVDGVFSMEGDLAKLDEIVALAKKYNANVMVDEAHSFGVLGKEGRGICNAYNCTDDVDLIMGTFSKSLASLGGFIASDNATINYLRHHSRSYIFSASITPASTAAASEALDIMVEEPERIAKLWELTYLALGRFRSAGFEIGKTSTPIIPLYIRNNELTFLITRELLDLGVFVNPVVSPAVSPQDTLIRFSIMATHTTEQLHRGIDAIEQVFRKHQLIP